MRANEEIIMTSEVKNENRMKPIEKLLHVIRKSFTKRI